MAPLSAPSAPCRSREVRSHRLGRRESAATPVCIPHIEQERDPSRRARLRHEEREGRTGCLVFKTTLAPSPFAHTHRPPSRAGSRSLADYVTRRDGPHTAALAAIPGSCCTGIVVVVVVVVVPFSRHASKVERQGFQTHRTIVRECGLWFCP